MSPRDEELQRVPEHLWKEAACKSGYKGELGFTQTGRGEAGKTAHQVTGSAQREEMERCRVSNGFIQPNIRRTE